ncbi:glycoside hydrolase family 17 protein [Ophiocordyceps camponoti-floridani]|uniref:Probable glucan endo-1,3-beta-glucosidase eglC n=1 Tax=Ophiocordyceps camponoti-floridani TaxID=2030778 RepID=A0A8H4VD60_9HYPO|nr:glycoside hydrolase family 17 protein [Ophiocordyceps camponoti-floridani]
MPFSIAQVLALIAAASSVSAVNSRGFNYGALKGSSPKVQADFENEFKAARELPGTNGSYTSARLYTMVQGGTTNEPISAIQAALDTNTSMLLGIWASAGDAAFANEMEALRKTTSKYCGVFKSGDVVGISIGSEDLYRETPTGKQNGENPGASPDTLVRYIKQTREVVKGTCLEKTPLGHVDTWTAYANSSNEAVFVELDWLGVDEYPFYEFQKPNAIGQAKGLYYDALRQVQAVIDKGGKKQEIWITEMGWPVSGATSGQAVASSENAEQYYKTVACPEFAARNVWYFTLQDGDSQNKPNPSFGVVEDVLQRPLKPLFDLSCEEANPSSDGAGKDDEARDGAGGKGGSDGAGSDKDGAGAKCASGKCSGGEGGSGSDSGSDSSSSDSGSKSDSNSGSRSGSNNASVTGSSSGSNPGSTSASSPGSTSASSPGSGSGPGSGSTPVSSTSIRPTGASNATITTNGGQLPSAVAAGSHLNSVGAAVAAVVLALAAL